MDRSLQIRTSTWILGAIAIVAIIIGGIYAAFSAQHPSEFALWATAYLVLVVGIMQLSFVGSLYAVTKRSFEKIAVLAFAIYNLGNLCVLYGTYLKGNSSSSTLLVNSGGVLLALSMVLLLYAVRHAKKTRLLYAYYVLICVILVSMPIGLVLASR